MAYKKPAQRFGGQINEVTIGSELKIGGESILPFYGFDGDTGHRPAVGMEIWDIYPKNWPDSLKDAFGNAAEDPVKWALHCESNFNPDFLCIRLMGANPDGGDKSPEECANLVKELSEKVKLPLVIAGCDSAEKNGKIFTKIAEAVSDKRYVFLSAVEANYKEVGASAGMAYGNIVAAESSVDLNLAKQLNILINQLGVKYENLVMDPGCSAVGYGFEYVVTTMDRIRLAALDQRDATLQLPMILPVSFEAWKVKESVAAEEDVPEWGSQEDRGVAMEISTAAGVLGAGADAVILAHPRSVEVIKEFLGQIAE